MASLYQTLEVSYDSHPDLIKSQFRKLRLETHPDMGETNLERFNDVRRAYNILSDNKKRAFYNRFGDQSIQYLEDEAMGYLMPNLADSVNLALLLFFSCMILAQFFTLPFLLSLKEILEFFNNYFVCMSFYFLGSIFLLIMLIRCIYYVYKYPYDDYKEGKIFFWNIIAFFLLKNICLVIFLTLSQIDFKWWQVACSVIYIPIEVLLCLLIYRLDCRIVEISWNTFFKQRGVSISLRTIVFMCFFFPLPAIFKFTLVLIPIIYFFYEVEKIRASLILIVPYLLYVFGCYLTTFSSWIGLLGFICLLVPYILVFKITKSLWKEIVNARILYKIIEKAPLPIVYSECV